MALQKQVVDLPLTGGMDEHADKRLAVRPLRLLNCVYRKVGSLAKRYGSRCLTADGKQNTLTFARPAGTSRVFGTCNPDVCSLASYPGALLRMNRGQVTRPMSSDTALATQGVQPVDTLASYYIERLGFVSGGILDLSVAATDEILWVAYVDTNVGALYIERRNAVTLALQWRECVGFGNTQSKPTVISYKQSGFRFAILVWRSEVSPNNIVARPYMEFTDGPAGGGGTTLMTGMTPAGIYDVATNGTDRMWVVGVQATGPAIKVARFDIGFGTITANGSATAALSSGVATDVDGVGIAYNATNNRLDVWHSQVMAGSRGVWGYFFSVAPALTGGPFIICGAASGHFGGVVSAPFGASGLTVWIASVQNATTLQHEILWRAFDQAGVDSGQLDRVSFLGLSIWSKPWQDASGAIYFFAYQTAGYSGDFVSYYVCRLSPHWEMLWYGASNAAPGPWSQGPTEVTAIVAPGQVQDGLLTPGQTFGRTGYKPATVGPRAVPRIESPTYPVGLAQAYACGILVGKVLDPTIQYVGLNGELATAEEVWSYTWADGPSRTLAISGGFQALYDGRYTPETGWFHAPAAQTVTATTTAGGLLNPAGKYTYRFVFSAVDAKGNVHRSPISSDVVVQLSAASGHTSTSITFKGTAVTRRMFGNLGGGQEIGAQPIYLEIYRTEANLSIFYLLAAKLVLDLDFTALSAYSDVTSDAALRIRPPLYTTGGNLESQPPPSARYVVVAGGRIFLGGTDDDSIWPSDLLVDGDPPTFNLLLVLPAFAGGRITGMGAMDAIVVLFKRDTIWAFSAGDGPADNGTGSFPPMTQVATDVGCIDARSITLVPEGLLFLSEGGLCLLGRGLQVVRVAKQVEDTTATGIIGGVPSGLVSGVLVAAEDEVRFPLMQQDDPGLGKRQLALLLDRSTGTTQPEWSVFEWATFGILFGLRIVSACMHGGRYTWIANNGHVFYEDEGTFLDHYSPGAGGVDTQWVYFDAWLAPWKPGLIQGFMRAWRVGALYELQTQCDLTIELRHDYKPPDYGADDSRTWQWDELAMLDRGQVRIHVVRQKSEALAVRVYDAPPSFSDMGSGQGFVLAGISLEYGMIPGGYRRPAVAKK